MRAQPARDLVGLAIEFNGKGNVRVVQMRCRAMHQSLVEIQYKSDRWRGSCFPRESGRPGLGNIWGKVFDKPVSAIELVGSEIVDVWVNPGPKLTDRTLRSRRRRLPRPDPRRCRQPPCARDARGGVRVLRA